MKPGHNSNKELVSVLSSPRRNGSTPSSPPREILHTRETQQRLGCSRWKLWDLCKSDPDFPLPRMVAGKRSWFADELDAYIETRPRRQYADRKV